MVHFNSSPRDVGRTLGPFGDKWGKNFVSLGIAEISVILKLLLILILPFTKPSWNNLNYASTKNIREVMKFYNLGNKSFKAGFSFAYFYPGK